MPTMPTTPTTPTSAIPATVAAFARELAEEHARRAGAGEEDAAAERVARDVLVRLREHPPFLARAVPGHPDLVHVFREYLPTSKRRASTTALARDARFVVVDRRSGAVVAHAPATPDHVEIDAVDRSGSVLSTFLRKGGVRFTRAYPGAVLTAYRHDGAWILASATCPDLLSRERSKVRDRALEAVERTVGKTFAEMTDGLRDGTDAGEGASIIRFLAGDDGVARAMTAESAAATGMPLVEEFADLDAAIRDASDPASFGFVARGECGRSFLVQHRAVHSETEAPSQRRRRYGDELGELVEFQATATRDAVALSAEAGGPAARIREMSADLVARVVATTEVLGRGNEEGVAVPRGKKAFVRVRVEAERGLPAALRFHMCQLREVSKRTGTFPTADQAIDYVCRLDERSFVSLVRALAPGPERAPSAPPRTG